MTAAFEDTTMFVTNFDASNLDCEYVQCAVCEKVIRGGNWFARINYGEWMIALCCPLCAETFENRPKPYVRRIETIELMRQSHFDSPLND